MAYLKSTKYLSYQYSWNKNLEKLLNAKTTPLNNILHIYICEQRPLRPPFIPKLLLCKQITSIHNFDISAVITPPEIDRRRREQVLLFMPGGKDEASPDGSCLYPRSCSKRDVETRTETRVIAIAASKCCPLAVHTLSSFLPLFLLESYPANACILALLLKIVRAPLSIHLFFKHLNPLLQRFSS